MQRSTLWEKYQKKTYIITYMYIIVYFEIIKKIVLFLIISNCRVNCYRVNLTYV